MGTGGFRFSLVSLQLAAFMVGYVVLLAVKMPPRPSVS